MRYIFVLIFFSFAAQAQAFDRSLALSHLLQNISPPGVAPGAVIASPSRQNPDYFFHWTRDAAITMQIIAKEYGKKNIGAKAKANYQKILENYYAFSLNNQSTASLGEPKFFVDGRVFDGPWGRPQNDGPAMRASALILWANTLLDEGKSNFVKKFLYGANPAENSVIKIDLEFVSRHWAEPSFDLWEEVQGMHFFTLMVQRKALLDGASLAERLFNLPTAAWYREQAAQITKYLERFWWKNQGYIMATTEQTGGLDYKFSNLDAAVILGVILGNTNDSSSSLFNEHILSTLLRLQNQFHSIYWINSNSSLGTAIGRYPEDRYN